MGYVAFQYAEALFNLAYEENLVDSVKKEYKAFTELMSTDVDQFLNHPKVHSNDKKTVVGEMTENTLVKHFLYVLIDNHRIDLIEEVYNEYLSIVDNQNKIMNVVVYSGKEMVISDLNKLKNNLAMKHNRKVNIKNVVDKKIVGGLRIEYDGNVLDQTINEYLNTLKNNLTK